MSNEMSGQSCGCDPGCKPKPYVCEGCREEQARRVVNVDRQVALAWAKARIKEQINDMCDDIHQFNEKWWCDPATGRKVDRNVGELLMLVVSEIAEAMEGHRKGLMDDKLPTRSMLEVELADALIRLLDMAAGLGLDLGGAYAEKMAFNATRKDHSIAARLAPGGKKY